MNDINVAQCLFGLVLIFFGFAAMAGIEQVVRAFRAWRGR